MEPTPIIVIGGGAMGGALAMRWKKSMSRPVHVVETDGGRSSALTAKGISCHATLSEAPQGGVYLLAIKPQQFAGYVRELKAALGGSATPLLISIMAGITLAELARTCQRVVRVMPSLPATVGESMSVLCASPALDARARAEAEALFARVGKTAWVEQEVELHAITAISGSGPAYVFAFMEALEQAARNQGISPALAKTLVTQTVHGASVLAQQSPESVATLRAQVTSPGGTTEAALNVLEQGQLSALLDKAVVAAETRSRELSEVK